MAVRFPGAAAWGCCAFSDLPLSPDQRAAALALCPGAAGVFVAAYPYYAGDTPGNLSLYARGRDYHAVLLPLLQEAAAGLEREHPGHAFVPGADNSPLPERLCAARAGLGLVGDNGLTILPPYGSYIFLGTLLTDLPLSSPPAGAGECAHCGRCLAACPAGALGPEGFRLDRCLSHLTQKKGTLTEEETALVQAHPLIWGCDACQTACPYNRAPALSPLPAFREGLTASLAAGDLEGLTNRTFRAAYGDRAFAWRGPAVLRRNLELKKEQ